MKRLSLAEYLATMAEPMKRLSAGGGAPVDFWLYFDSIPTADFEQHDCSAGLVTHVWEHPAGRYQHVLVDSEDKNVFMVVALNLHNGEVLGHRLLDLNREYGLTRA